jgi:glycosyltransferase involved in cell wall biosynthesis
MIRFIQKSEAYSVKANRTDIFSDLNCCIIVPTYNNAGTLRNVLDGILRHTSHVIVVNDGSTDQTKDILHLYKDIKVIENKINRGKGYALKKSFRIASETGYEYAITIDSDGQHDPDDLPKFRSALKENPETLIIGARNMDQQGIPGKSSFGHKFSNFWFLVETGIKLPDTQTGYRLYPIKRISGMLFFTNKFEFEIEVLVRTAWKGIPITSIPVNVYYPPAGKRISHFRPFRDFARVSILNSVLVLLAFLYFRPILYFKDFNLKKLKKLLGSGESSLKLSMATGFGVFMGIIPIWGFQMITAAFLAHIFRLNKALVLVASNISIPPMMPVIIYLSFVMGRIFVANPVYIAFNKHITLESAKISFIQYIYGSIPLAISAGLLAAIFTYIFLYFRRNGRKK